MYVYNFLKYFIQVPGSKLVSEHHCVVIKFCVLFQLKNIATVLLSIAAVFIVLLF